ncbi:MAG TPA: MBL fold metallo-hydrolase [Patescibacteria group bacterium]
MTKPNLLKLALMFVFFGLIALGSAGFLPQASIEEPGGLKVAFMDVGQGDAILLRTPHRHYVLIDGGPDGTILSRLGEEMRFNEHTIDLVVVSHNHSDHIAGINRLIDRYDVQKMWISGAIHTTNEYLKLLDNIKGNSIPTEVVFKGKQVEIDGVKLQVLHPVESTESVRPEDQHDATIVIKATYGEKSLLLTGDIDEGHEQNIIKSLGDAAGTVLNSDVLKVPHHGSKSGLALNFLNFVDPKYAVIQVGAKNSFGHPAASILQKLRDKGVRVFRNDQDGTVRFYSDGKDIIVNP